MKLNFEVLKEHNFNKIQKCLSYVQPNPLGAVSEGQVDRKVEMINDRKAEAVSDDSD